MAKPKLNRSGAKHLKKGMYEVKNVDKYIGNPLECMYRSGWEKRFMIFLDFNERVTKWGSELENYVIPYQDMNGKWHKYYPDFYAEIGDPNNPHNYQKTLIEIKPYNDIYPKFIETDKQTGRQKVKPPKSFRDLKAFENFEYQLKTYEKNRLKWEYARKYCANRHMHFWLIDEKWLKEKKIL